MALVLKDRISETSTTSGTGAITLAGATTGFIAFSTIGDGNTTYYCITDGSAWEVGLGTYTSSGNTLARTTVYSNSNGNTTPITLSGGIKNVFGVLPADGIITVSGTSIQVPGTAVLSVANGGTGSNTATFSGENITSINANNVSTGILAVAQGGTGSSTATFSGANITSLNASSISTGTLGVANGGTGAATLDANNVILGNGTSAVQFVAPGTSANVLTSDGSTWISQAPSGGGGGGSIGGQVFTGNGTFTIPTGVTSLKITVVGGGGGGQGAQTTSATAGCPGAGGGAAIKYLTGLTPGNTLSVTVGAGGTAGAAANGNGGTGGTSSVASGTQSITTVSATGGTGGANTGPRPNGGIGSNGDLNIRGQGVPSGGPGVSAGGSSILGGGAPGRNTDGTGTAGGAYGGGGSGGFYVTCSSSRAGGAGAAGVVVFEW